ncbi:MAG TPA: ABC transporter ATP-binding protein [Clostridia bacterium]|nr:ABC transporter ATP-binding protein [Clostridia bacterium]
MKELKKQLKYFEGYKLIYLIAFIAVSIAEIAALLIPIIIKFSIDSLIGDEPYGDLEWFGQLIRGRLIYACFAIIFVALIHGLFLFFKGKAASYAAENVIMNLKNDLFNHIQHLPYRYFSHMDSGDLIQRSTSDIETIRRFLAVQFVEVVKVIVMLIAVTYLMLSLSVKLTVVGLILVPVIIAFTFFYFLKVKKRFKKADESEAELSTVLKENLSGVRVVKAFNREKTEIDKFDKKNHGYSKDIYYLIKELAIFWSVSDLLCYTQASLVVLFGVKYAYQGELTIGVIVAFMTYETMLMWPVRQLGRVLTDFGKASVSLKRINEIFDENIDEAEDTGIKPKIKGDIEFKNVRFAFDEDVVLNDLSFKINKGETVGILGSTGSGKSTIIKLISRLYDYDAGSITIDGIELEKINKKWIRQHLGLVLQEPFLFAKSIKDNIRLGNHKATQKSIEEVTNIAAIHDNILEFDEGYDTLVGEKGVSLSGGQKQRIAIARSLIKNSPIIIFDDSLSAVDTETDIKIRRALKNRSDQLTTIIISHRINTLRETDKILVLDQGKIVDSGNHAELVEKEGFYNKIWKIQSNKVI